MSVVSDTLIANMALDNVGAKSVIASIGENSPEAKACKLWYDMSRRQALEAYNWSFARRKLTLASHSDPAPEPRWNFRYQYPVDCVKARLIENPLGEDADAIPFDLELSDDASVKTIVTNQDDAVLIYTADITQTSLFSMFFVDTLSSLLAARIAIKLTGKRTLKGDMIQQYNALLRIAPAHDANEAVGKKPREAEHIRARG